MAREDCARDFNLWQCRECDHEWPLSLSISQSICDWCHEYGRLWGPISARDTLQMLKYMYPNKKRNPITRSNPQWYPLSSLL